MRKLSGYGPSLIVLVTAAVVLLAGPQAVRQLTYEQTRARIVQARHSLDNNDILARLNEAYRDIATLVEPSVVHVSAHYTELDALGNQRMGLSTGSGWVYDDQGHIVTNHHVVQNAVRIQVQMYNGELRDAVMVGSDFTTDIAVIKVDPERLHPATIAETDATVKQGDMVFAFGSPFDFRFSMSSGVVSGKGRSVGVIRDELGNRTGYENFIQVDAAINPGNSGGPLTDHRGYVIGMNTAIATGRSRHSFEEGQFAGIGLAIPIDMIRPVVTQLIENGYVTKGYLGVLPEELTAEIARELGYIGSGVLAAMVPPDGPAARSGMRIGDIITHVGDRPVSSREQLRSTISSLLPGETVALRIWRYDHEQKSGGIVELQIMLDELDMLAATGRIPPSQSHEGIPQIGIKRMTTNTPELAQQHGTQAFMPGVMILETTPNTFFARRVEPGTVIVEVMDKPVRDVEEFINVLRDYNLAVPGGVRAMMVDPHGRQVLGSLRLQ